MSQRDFCRASAPTHHYAFNHRPDSISFFNSGKNAIQKQVRSESQVQGICLLWMCICTISPPTLSFQSNPGNILLECMHELRTQHKMSKTILQTQKIQNKTKCHFCSTPSLAKTTVLDKLGFRLQSEASHASQRSWYIIFIQYTHLQVFPRKKNNLNLGSYLSISSKSCCIHQLNCIHSSEWEYMHNANSQFLFVNRKINSSTYLVGLQQWLKS